MGNLKKRTIACPGTCMDNDACKQTKLVYCYNIRKIQTTAISKKVAHFWKRNPPPVVSMAITCTEYSHSNKIQKQYDCQDMEELQYKKTARILGKAITGKNPNQAMWKVRSGETQHSLQHHYQDEGKTQTTAPQSAMQTYLHRHTTFCLFYDIITMCNGILSTYTQWIISFGC